MINFIVAFVIFIEDRDPRSLLRKEASLPDGNEGPRPAGITISELFTTYEPGLRRFTQGLAQDADLADDLVQEAFIQAMHHLDLLRQLNPYQQRSWLFTVVKNRFIDHQRAQARRQNLLASLADNALAEDAPDYDFSLTPLIAQNSLSRRIPEPYRSLLEKRYLLGMTSQEIGAELRIPDATVRSRLRFAINWVRVHQNELI